MDKTYDQILKKALLRKGVLAEEDIDNVFKEIASTKDNLLSALTKKNLISRKDALDILGQELGFSTIDLKNFSFQKELVGRIPTKIAFYYKFMPVQIKGRILTIAVSSPLDIKVQDEIRTHLGYDIEMVLALEEDIDDALKRFYGLGAETLEKITAPVTQKLEAEKIENIEELAEEASVIKLVNQIIFEGFKLRATDIHIEPQREGISVRYRIDGVLYDAKMPSEIKEFILPIISRIKIMCNLNIVERRMPQDGRAIVKTQDQALDLRVSTMPTPYGESMVIRILPTKMLFSLEKLGLLSRGLKILENLISKPYGIIFITGPTGSGKTTSLYACLSKLNTRNRKIVTIEDPIEYELSGITQIQVAPEIGFDFARGLRSILRHDPDIIMVGEVRDLETAEIAIRVALTGHLVFSTLHTNDAASGVTRLVDIGIEPYLISSIVQSFIAQRLVRVICPTCKNQDSDVPWNIKERVAKDLGLKSTEEVTIYKGGGCDNCNFTGFVGRTGIYEILLIDDVIRDFITKRLPSEELKKIAIDRGLHTLEQDGWQKVIAGITTPSEVLRVISTDTKTAEDSLKYSLRGGSYSLESRRYPRLNTQVNVRYHLIRSKEELSKKGYSLEKFSITKNICAGGIAFIFSESIAVGSMLELTLELPDGKEAISCLAKVVWAKEIEPYKSYEMGICFLDLTGGERTRINSFVVEETA